MEVRVWADAGLLVSIGCLPVRPWEADRALPTNRPVRTQACQFPRRSPCPREPCPASIGISGSKATPSFLRGAREDNRSRRDNGQRNGYVQRLSQKSSE
jgi:hypothetical protein